jgi:anaerobic ribonucleoside-triphosphate reductase
MITQANIKKSIKTDFKEVRKDLLYAVIVNIALGVGIVVQMYFNQKLIVYRLDRIEERQEKMSQQIYDIHKEIK